MVYSKVVILVVQPLYTCICLIVPLGEVVLLFWWDFETQSLISLWKIQEKDLLKFLFIPLYRECKVFHSWTTLDVYFHIFPLAGCNLWDSRRNWALHCQTWSFLTYIKSLKPKCFQYNSFSILVNKFNCISVPLFHLGILLLVLVLVTFDFCFFFKVQCSRVEGYASWVCGNQGMKYSMTQP